MRIAQVAPLAESVPPRLYGGTERVVAWLIEELVALGHDVTLFASGDSKTSARLVPVWPRALRLGRPRTDPMVPLTHLLEAVGRAARDFDVIHCHIDWVPLPLLSRLGVPFLTTTHGRLDLPGQGDLARRFPDAAYVSISDNQRLPLGEANWLGTVYHGLPVNSLKPCFEPGSYLAFLGRLVREKGPEGAMRIARAAGLPLHIAAKVPSGERGYFKEELAPKIDGHHVRLTGEVDDTTKQAFLAGAAALLFPIDWPEPFGLVMVEAMACGTPVLAFRGGAVEEVLRNGVTGAVVDTVDEAVAALPGVLALDRAACREEFERRFSARRMARDYVRVYERLMETSRRAPAPGWSAGAASHG